MFIACLGSVYATKFRETVWTDTSSHSAMVTVNILEWILYQAVVEIVKMLFFFNNIRYFFAILLIQ